MDYPVFFIVVFRNVYLQFKERRYTFPVALPVSL
jgi:hypothetical protein